MAGALPHVVIACLDDVRAGRRTAEQCLAEHPEMAAELHELLPVAMAVTLGGVPHLDEAAQQRGRARLLGAISSNGHHAAEDRRILGRGRGWVAQRWLAALCAAFGAAAAGGAVVYAAQGAPPDSPLHPVRQAVQVVAQVVSPATPTPLPALSPTPSAIPTLSAPPAVARAAPAPSSPPPRAPSSAPAALAPAATRATSPTPSQLGRANGKEEQRGPAPENDQGHGKGNDGNDNGRLQAAITAENRGQGDDRGDERATATPAPSGSGSNGDDHGQSRRERDVRVLDVPAIRSDNRGPEVGTPPDLERRGNHGRSAAGDPGRH